MQTLKEDSWMGKKSSFCGQSLQWIPSHVNIQGNEIAVALAKAGADDASVPSAPLTYLELFSTAKSRNKTIWLIPPEHHWYQGSRPGAQDHGPDIALLIYGDHHHQQQQGRL
ncbi:hypothetical protein AVEN_102024-1, partial [Araneus ventricosus]